MGPTAEDLEGGRVQLNPDVSAGKGLQGGSPDLRACRIVETILLFSVGKTKP